MSDILNAVQRMIDSGQKIEIAEGSIQSVNGAVANVLVSGASRQQAAWYLKGATLSPGDSCVLLRTPKSNRWIVLGGFSTNIGGGSDTLLTRTGDIGDNSASAGEYRNSGFRTEISATTVSIANQNAVTLALATIKVTKAYGTVHVGFSGWLQGTTIGLWGGVSIRVNDVLIANSRGSLSSSVAANARENLSTTGIYYQIPAGTYTVEVRVETNSVSGADNILIGSPQFYAIEV